MAYAIVKAGGHQHRVVKGERLTLDLQQGDVGAELIFDEVLLLKSSDGKLSVGQPLVAGAKVTAKIVAQGRGPKIRVFKRRRRKGFHKTIGHRSEITEVEILTIAG